MDTKYKEIDFDGGSKRIFIKKFFEGLDFKPILLIIPAVLSLMGAFFEGVSLGLLIPLIKGIIQGDFSFVKEIPVLSKIMVLFPQALIVYRPNTSTFIFLLAIVFSSALFKNIFVYVSSLLVSKQIEYFISNLRKLIFSRYLCFGKLFFDRNNTGYLHTVIIGFTTELSNVARRAYVWIVEFFMLATYLTIMLIISWKLTILSLIIFPLIYYSTVWLVKRIKNTSISYASASQKLASDIFNILACIPLVKSYAKEEDERVRFGEASDRVAEWQISMAKKSNLVQPLQEMVTLTALLVLVASMAFVIVKERAAEVSSLLVFFLVLRRTMNSFSFLNRTRFELAKLFGPIQKIMEMKSDEDKFFVMEGQKEFKSLQNAIEYKHLNFAYLPEIPVLEDLSLSVEKGKMVAIVGPTGSGKTTILNLLMRFYDCSPNSLFINGEDIRNFTLESLKKHMAFISQEVLLFNDTLHRNIVYGMERETTEDQVSEVVRRAQLDEFVKKLPKGLNTIIGDRGVRLSGGEKQRVSIARALLKKSEILILDEATSALDTTTEQLIQSAIDEAVSGHTSIVVAHRLSTIRHADKIIVIEDGHLIEEGGLKDLLEKKGKFYQYWEAQKFF